MPNIIHFLTIDAPLKKVYRNITEQDGLAGWWTEQTRAKAEVGHINHFDFDDRYHNEFKIIELVENKKVVWECIEGADDWIGTRIVFELEPANVNTTALRFGHVGWKEESDFFGSCNYHWGLYMESLKNLCETGKGDPFTGY